MKGGSGRRRGSAHGRVKRLGQRRAATFRAFQAEEPPAPICPVHRKASWPTRAGAQRNMRDVSNRHDFVSRGDGWELNTYACPHGHGWHWGHTRPGSAEQTS